MVEGDTYSESKDFTFKPGTSGTGKKSRADKPVLEEEEDEEGEEAEAGTMRRKATPVTMTVLSNEWAEPGDQRTPNELQVCCVCVCMNLYCVCNLLTVFNQMLYCVYSYMVITIIR